MENNQCSHDKCHLDVYDGEKCIFHCEKTKDNGWIIDEKASSVEDRWDLKKVEEFWVTYLNDSHTSLIKSLIPPFLLNKKILFERDKDISLYLNNCEILDDFRIDDFHKKIKFSLLLSNSTIHGKLSFFNFLNPQISIYLKETLHKDNIEIFSIANIHIENISVNIIKLGTHNNIAKYKKIHISSDSDEYQIEKIDMKNIKVSNSFTMKNISVNLLDCSDSIFEDKVEIHNSMIRENASFVNTKFKQIADFNNTTFYKNNFMNTLFEDTTSFIESKFCDDVDFKYTIFEKLVIFRKAIFEKSINLEDSIIKGEANFLNITSKNREINIANKETARIIKHSFDKVGNTTEANKYFTYEMKKEKESVKDDFNKRIMLNLNYWISNFGQSWLRPLGLIFIVALIHTFLIYAIDNGIFHFIHSTDFMYKPLKWVVDFSNDLAKNILPFKKPLSEGKEFISLIFLIIYSTLIYNLIIAVKRITKR